MTTEEQSEQERNDGATDMELLRGLHFWTVRQVQNHLDISDRTFENWLAAGHIAVTRFNGQRLLTPEQLRIAVGHAGRSYKRRGVPFQPRELGEPVRFQIEG
jgi:hypothetical protein